MTIDEAMDRIIEAECSPVFIKFLLVGMEGGEGNLLLFITTDDDITYSFRDDMFYSFMMHLDHTDIIERESDEWNKLLHFLRTLDNVTRM